MQVRAPWSQVSESSISSMEQSWAPEHDRIRQCKEKQPWRDLFLRSPLCLGQRGHTSMGTLASQACQWAEAGVGRAALSVKASLPNPGQKGHFERKSHLDILEESLAFLSR